MELAIWIPKCLHWPFCPGVFIAILAFLAAAVTFRDPGRREKAIWTFVFLGLMCAEVWMMSMDRESSEVQQGQILQGFRDVGDGIKATVTGLNANLETTQKILGQTLPQADMRYVAIELPPGAFPLYPGRELRFNFHFTNAGNDVAQNFEYLAKLYIGKLDDKATQVALAKRFEQVWKTERRHGNSQRPGPSGAPSSFDTFTAMFQEPEVGEFNSGKETVYVLTRLAYLDKTGKNHLKI